MYANVPSVLPAVVKPVSPAVRARPKSIRYTKSRSVIRMFDGLTSRWIRPASCAASSAVATCSTTVTANAGAERLLGCPRSMVAEVAALDQPHVQVEQAVDLAVAVDRHHVRIVEPGRGLRFAPEPLLEDRVLGEMVRQHLERDDAIGLGVVGPVDLAHTAPADQLLQLIVPEWCRIHRLTPRQRLSPLCRLKLHHVCQVVVAHLIWRRAL